MRSEASGHKALQTSMKVEQVLAKQDLPVTEDTTLHDLSQRQEATRGVCSTPHQGRKVAMTVSDAEVS